MRFFKPVLAAAAFISVVAINACRKGPDNVPFPPSNPPSSAKEDTAYTDLHYGMRILKSKHSDVVPLIVEVSIQNQNGPIDLKFQNYSKIIYDATGSYDKYDLYREDSLKFNHGDQYINAGNFATNHSDMLTTYNSDQSDRLKITDLYRKTIKIAKPANNAENGGKQVTLTVQWLDNDIPGPFNEEQERQRNNTTINEINSGKTMFWLLHL